jgi:hypothetical protein
VLLVTDAAATAGSPQAALFLRVHVLVPVRHVLRHYIDVSGGETCTASLEILGGSVEYADSACAALNVLRCILMRVSRERDLSTLKRAVLDHEIHSVLKNLSQLISAIDATLPSSRSPCNVSLSSPASNIELPAEMGLHRLSNVLSCVTELVDCLADENMV